MALITRRTALQLGASAAALGASGGLRLAQSSIKTADRNGAEAADREAARRCACSARCASCSRTRMCSAPTAPASPRRPASQVRVDFVGWEDITPADGGHREHRRRPRRDHRLQRGAAHLRRQARSICPTSPSISARSMAAGCRSREKYGKQHGTNNWIGLPFGASGGPLVWRKSAVERGRLPERRRTTTPASSTSAGSCKAANKPAGFALGNAVGDGNGFANWLIWSHGGFLVDEDGKVAINSTETHRGAELPEGALPDLRAGHDRLGRHQQQPRLCGEGAAG